MRRLVGDVRAAEGCLTRCAVAILLESAPSSRPTSPVPRLSPQGTPEALPYLILRRLSSTSKSGTAPRSAWLEAAPAGQRAKAVCISYLWLEELFARTVSPVCYLQAVCKPSLVHSQ